MKPRLRIISEALFYGLLPSRVYEPERHYDCSYWRHAGMNLALAGRWLTGRETAEDRSFEYLGWARYEVRRFRDEYGQYGCAYADPQSLYVVARHRRWVTARLHALVIYGGFLAREGHPTCVQTGDGPVQAWPRDDAVPVPGGDRRVRSERRQNTEWSVVAHEAIAERDRARESEEEFALRLVDAADVLATVETDDGEITEAHTAGLLSALDHALRGSSGCMEPDEWQERRRQALAKHGDYLGLGEPA